MTAEIGILNKHGIALAADSAVTIGNGKKFYNTANKLFALSKYNPVGIMIYNNAEFMGCPIEIIIKEYRKQINDNTYDKLYEYWKKFLEYLKNQFGINNNVEYYIMQVQAFLKHIDYSIRSEVETIFNDANDVSQEEIEKEVTDVIHKIIDNAYNNYNSLENDEKFLNKYDLIKDETKSVIEELIKDIIGNLPSDDCQKLIECSIMILTKLHKDGNRTGIVITGFGEKELYPKLINGEFMGVFFGEIKYYIRDNIEITNEDDARIIPFAQDDVVLAFLYGIDEGMFGEIINTLDEIKDEIKDKIDCKCDIDACVENFKKKIVSRLNEASSEFHWGPMLNTVSVAPKEELAQMAETLVSLTSFRRKLSMDNFSQTVGGPVDVALISKGDGFIWIKRKLYFDKKLNHHFTHNYFK